MLLNETVRLLFEDGADSEDVIVRLGLRRASSSVGTGDAPPAALRKMPMVRRGCAPDVAGKSFVGLEYVGYLTTGTGD